MIIEIRKTSGRIESYNLKPTINNSIRVKTFEQKLIDIALDKNMDTEKKKERVWGVLKADAMHKAKKAVE